MMFKTTINNFTVIDTGVLIIFNDEVARITIADTFFLDIRYSEDTNNSSPGVIPKLKENGTVIEVNLVNYHVGKVGNTFSERVAIGSFTGKQLYLIFFSKSVVSERVRIHEFSYNLLLGEQSQ